MSMRPSGDTARGLVFDDFVDKQVVHVSATSFRSGAERVSMRLHGESGHPGLPRQIFFGAIPPGGQTAMWRLPTNHKHGGDPTR